MFFQSLYLFSPEYSWIFFWKEMIYYWHFFWKRCNTSILNSKAIIPSPCSLWLASQSLDFLDAVSYKVQCSALHGVVNCHWYTLTPRVSIIIHPFGEIYISVLYICSQLKTCPPRSKLNNYLIFLSNIFPWMKTFIIVNM